MEIGAADTVKAAFPKIDAPGAVAMVLQSDNAIAADHFRAVNPHELVAVHPRLERLDRLVNEPAAGADIKPHIVALGLNEVDLVRVDAQHLAAILDPEFADPSALARTAMVCRAPFAHPCQRPRK